MTRTTPAAATGTATSAPRIHAKGLRTGSAEVLKQLQLGEDVDPHSYVFRTTVQIETASPGLAHLQQALFLAAAQRQTTAVRYRAYRVG
ncbi:DUF3237 family protein [Plantibacter sp. VKM Ac-2885]|uniref:DUF3237 family protein n=1 Tax=Plantibacter sp. VKM Ac-2885 TaxID=2783828 RepID=UPI00351C3E64